jgi:hypothetical protein
MKYSILTIAMMMIILPSTVFASSNFIAGKIQGASYVFNHTVQPQSGNDPKAAMEREFVLQTAEGKVYFLLNVPRSMKIKAVNKDVRVYGDTKADGTIFVHQIMIKYGDSFVTLCDWDSKVKENESN